MANWIDILKNLSQQSGWFSNPTTTGLPRSIEQLGGAASLIAGLRNQPSVDIPEFASFATPQGTAAKNFLQRGFESPVNPLAPGGIYEQYLPFIKRQEEELMEGLGNKFSAAFPANVGMQGSEVLATRRLGEEFLQNRQKLIADLTRENAERQRLEATALADVERTGQTAGFNTAFAGAMQAAEAERQRNANLAALGLALLTDKSGNQQIVNVGGPGGGGIRGTDGASQTTGPGGALSTIQQLLGKVLPSPTKLGQLDYDTWAQLLGYGAGGMPGSPFIFTTAGGETAAIGIDEATQLAAQGYGSQITASGTAAAGGTGASAAGFQGVLGTGAGATATAGVVGGVGGGYIGYRVGTAFADSYEKKHAGDTSNLGGFYRGAFTGAATGAASGAAIGFTLADGPGAVAGAVIGGTIGYLGGGVSGIYAERRREDKQKEAEAGETAISRPQAEKWFQEFADNATQKPAAQQTALQIEPRVQALLDADSPTTRNIINTIRSLTGDSFTNEGGTALPTSSQANPPAKFLLDRLVRGAFDTNLGVEANRQNPESVVGRIYSEETGKFTSAFETLRSWRQTMIHMQQLWQSLLQEVGASNG